MRKVLIALAVFSLTGLLAACSDDETPVTPEPEGLSITTTEIAAGYTCNPYIARLEASGGTEPYIWSLAAGSTLPDGVSLTAEGRIIGVLEETGSWNFTVVCTDAAATPGTDQVALDLDIEAPPNPSVAIWYDGEATICGSETTAFTPLDCFVFVMFDEGVDECTFGAEFRVFIEDQDGVPLDLGTQYNYSYVAYPERVAVSMGDPVNGVAISFSRGWYSVYSGNAPVVSFGLLLLEDLENLTFRVGPSPMTDLVRPIIATCDEQHSLKEVDGRSSALNYAQ